MNARPRATDPRDLALLFAILVLVLGPPEIRRTMIATLQERFPAPKPPAGKEKPPCP